MPLDAIDIIDFVAVVRVTQMGDEQAEILILAIVFPKRSLVRHSAVLIGQLWSEVFLTF